MVTLLLSGGLGNQMFQYAAAKALAKRLDTSLRIDTYSLTKKTQATARAYELDIFNIDVPLVSSLRGKCLIKLRPYVQQHRAFFQKFGFLTDTYAILYQPVIETMKGNITMSGYFQNERYFNNIASDIRRDFTFRKPLADSNLSLSERLKRINSVSVHIRRGDYLSNKSASANFITCDSCYYEKAIKAIAENVKTPEFFVFSDDHDRVRGNISFAGYPVTFIDWNKGSDSYIDMQLMSLCKHNIIANSSFSWWGAWLNANTEKIVIAPEKWFQDNKKNALLDNFYPEGWRKM
ncbi:hypothetical protein M2451_002213 [Dysgonomonas sp. PFB1-18]|uniref:alpha-1,2-fucosyltransferase n=1 Tax=unclassified Dysgonomonas TaxID=2630389 RepID=UPI002476A867|nr:MULTISPECIES: alpha-1,2-fucosyltransferase [unclassified Dysgonomonas]MDH6309842.1 hypothetical protein [Dysgonomonas sp. PF1-14]MDH6339386.1 hypothetical protein [Dysgonomonas sp. PF1-16]MDH6380885.1 hypothetical protein [Dysgonomonas sp. PFB1-18]MDH6397894.1 hypothetical protein [Dysgonomonas sp. PF1-23]